MKVKLGFPISFQILIGISLSIAICAVSLNRWVSYQERVVNYTPWSVVKINNGYSIVVTRDDKEREVSLCGVQSLGDETKKYLTSLINLSNGTLYLEQVESGYEAWLLLRPGYNIDLVKHISAVPDKLVDGQIHINTWLIERGMARRNVNESVNCKEPQHLALAETIAKETKLGFWGNR